jgi:hypothetical protein
MFDITNSDIKASILSRWTLFNPVNRHQALLILRDLIIQKFDSPDMAGKYFLTIKNQIPGYPANAI